MCFSRRCNYYPCYWDRPPPQILFHLMQQHDVSFELRIVSDCEVLESGEQALMMRLFVGLEFNKHVRWMTVWVKLTSQPGWWCLIFSSFFSRPPSFTWGGQLSNSHAITTSWKSNHIAVHCLYMLWDLRREAFSSWSLLFSFVFSWLNELFYKEGSLSSAGIV